MRGLQGVNKSVGPEDMVKAFLLGSHRGLRLCWCRELIHCVVVTMYL